MSLKSSLQQIIKDRNGEVFTLKELEDYCHKAGFKISNAERRLRESPEVEPVYNQKHTAIVAYKAISTPNLPRGGTIDPNDCCYSFKVFGTHTADCVIQEQINKTNKILANAENQPTLFKSHLAISQRSGK